MLRAACEDGPTALNFDGFRDGQSIFKLDSEVPNRAVHLCVTKLSLNYPQVSGFLVDLSDLGSSHRMRPVAACFEAYRRDPVTNNPCVLAR